MVALLRRHCPIPPGGSDRRRDAGGAASFAHLRRHRRPDPRDAHRSRSRPPISARPRAAYRHSRPAVLPDRPGHHGARLCARPRRLCRQRSRRSGPPNSAWPLGSAPATAVISPSRSMAVWCGGSIRSSRTLTGAFRRLKENETRPLALPPGWYVVPCQFSVSASAAKTVHLRSDAAARETFDLPAGGLRLEGKVGDVRIPPGRSPSTSIAAASSNRARTSGRSRRTSPPATSSWCPRGHLLHRVQLRRTRPWCAPTSACSRGKLADVTVRPPRRHRGGRWSANGAGRRWPTQTGRWSAPGRRRGEGVDRRVPKVILAEGDYRAIARNEGKTYDAAGVDGEVKIPRG